MTKASKGRRDKPAVALDAILLSHIRDSIIVTDLDGIVTYWNTGATRLFGFKAKEILGRHISERFPEPARAQVIEWVRKVAAGETEFKGEQLDYHKDGSRIWIEVNTRLVRDAEGKPLAVMAISHDVTLQRQAMRQLEENRRRLDAALKTALMAAWEWNPASDRIQISDSAREVFGLGRGEKIENRVQASGLVHPEDAERHRAMVNKAAEQGESWHAEFRIIRPRDRRIAWMEERATAVRDPDTGDVRLTGLVWDVTDRHLADEALRESESRFRTLVRNIPDYAIFMIDPKGFIIGWWEGAERVKGYKAEEVLGKRVSLFYTPEDVAAGEVQRDLQEATRKGRVERESWRVRKGGERFWADEIMTAIHDVDGRLLGFTKIARDLSDRKQVADALRESEERFRSLVENVRDHAIFTLDAQGRITTWNPGAKRIFGYDTDRIIGKPGSLLFTPEDRATGEHKKELATATREGRASDDRWQLRRDGTRFWASGVTSAMRDEGGRLRGFTKVLRDLTQAKVLAEQREQVLEKERIARQEAERAMTMKDEFLAVISHELKTPLGAVLLWSKLLESGGIKRADQPEAIRIIRQSAEAQRQLIEDLLDMSRVSSGKVRLNLREVDLAPIVRNAAETMRPEAQARGITLQTSLGKKRIKALADPDRIRQVVWNLLDNGVKFTDQGGRVRLRLQASGRHVRLEISDTGQGIARDFLPHVFEPFRQADASTTREHGGLGLGLTISRQIVDLHGGAIRARSRGIGKGATFILELPTAGRRAIKKRPGRATARRRQVAKPTESRRRSARRGNPT
ncbi:MAG TPA: PAS domain S-box protein [Tepidisphaeraceae bacterium]|nr:PAS domain S-box protein [Tepidisphaeraceae bacterium]